MAKTADDPSDKETEAILNDLEKRISQVYAQAAAETQKTIDDYFSTLTARVEKEYSLVEQGVITEQSFRNWCVSAVARGSRYEAMRDSLAERYTRANEVAVAYVNDDMAAVYGMNRTYTVQSLKEESEKLGADYSGVNFIQYDEATVKRMIVEQPELMPYYPEQKAVNRGFDLAYGKTQITAAVTSSILQGKSIGKVANDLQTRIPTMNRASAIRTARTAITSAQNGGRQAGGEDMEAMGCVIEKEWHAHIDERTREAHADADGQTVPMDDTFNVGGEELMFPGDPDGSPENTYNCRCTMHRHVTEFHSILPEELQGSIHAEVY